MFVEVQKIINLSGGGVSFFLIIVLSLGLTGQVFAQADSLTVRSDIGLNGRWQSGNLNQFGVNPHAQLLLANQKFSSELKVDYQYMNVEKFNLINDLWLREVVKINPGKKVYPMAVLISGFAKSYDIKQSLSVGAGAGLNLRHKSPFDYFRVGLYGGHFYFEYNNEVPLKGATIHSMINAMIPLAGKMTLIWDLDTYNFIKDGSIWGLNNSVVFQFEIAKNLSLNLIHSTIFNSKTTANIKKINTLMMFGINYKFNK